MTPPGSPPTIAGVRALRDAIHTHGPSRSRPFERDFARVALPREECDRLRDALAAEGARSVIEVGLAYGVSALAIGEALLHREGETTAHVVIDPFQESFGNAGWEAITAAGLAATTRLMAEPSSLALARLVLEGFSADAAFVDGSHRFHEVFVDLYFLRKLVRPGGLVVLDDAEWPSVGTALSYYDVNLGWTPEAIGGRLVARRIPADATEPPFTEFRSF